MQIIRSQVDEISSRKQNTKGIYQASDGLNFIEKIITTYNFVGKLEISEISEN